MRTKRPEWLTEIAGRMSAVKFTLVGGVDRDQSYSDRVTRSAGRLENLDNRGKVNYDQVFDFISSSSILLNTSVYEGFPNTFLEAWSCGVPVISTVDPDGLLNRYKVGIQIGSIDDAVTAIQALKDDKGLLESMSKNCVAYYAQNHTPNVVARKFGDFFDRIVDKRNQA